MQNIFTPKGLALVALLTTGPAFAQDFDGPYAGAQGGWQRMDVRDPATNFGTVTLDSDRQSFSGGLFVGYDRQISSRIVVGTEAGIDVSADDAVETATGIGLVTIDSQWSLDLTTRAGYRIDPRTLVYVRGGYTNVRVETTVTNGAAQLLERENRDGWTLGAGIEQHLLQRISGRLEYRYSDLSEGDGTFDRHRMLAGIAYRF